MHLYRDRSQRVRRDPRNPREINATDNENTFDRVNALLHGHKDHSVNVYECRLYLAMFAVQQKRNQLVDQPVLAPCIAFERGLR